MAKTTRGDVITYLEKATILEVSELVKEIEEKFDIKAAAPQIAMMPTVPGAGGDTAAAAEEKDEFELVLAEIGDTKIQVIKAVREITSLGLRDAKELVEGAPNTIKEGLKKEEAEEMKQKLESAGAKVELK